MPLPMTTKSSPTNRATAIMLGETLKEGSSSRRSPCPKCGGGSSAESSFIISKDPSGRVRWRCFRGSCGFKGASGGTVGVIGGTKPEGEEARPLKSAYEALPACQEAEFEEEFGFTPRKDLVKWVADGGYYCHQVMGPGWAHRGWHLRRYSWQNLPEDGKPRADNYRSIVSAPFICHYSRGSGPARAVNNGVVVVEDCVSALVLSNAGIDAVALLGTVLNLDRVYDILATTGGSKIIMALDKGTRDLQLRYKEQYAFLFESWTQWTLGADLKYVPQGRILDAYIGGKTDFVSS